MSELISKEELIRHSKDCLAYKEMVEELNTLLVNGAGKAIQYYVKYPNLIELIVDDLEEKGKFDFLSYVKANLPTIILTGVIVGVYVAKHFNLF